MKLQLSYIKVIKLLDRHGLVFLEANRSIHYLVFNAILKYIHDRDDLT